jgi:hypothetical protein
LDVHQVLADLSNEAILCCYEPPGQPCHRRSVAKWIERQTGLVVPELTLPPPDARLTLF